MTSGLSDVSFSEFFRTWLRISMLSFGGPAAQIAVMHRILVDEKRWIDERRFLHALNFCMLLPGPEAQQLATYIGWLMRGVRGGLVSGLLFILPGAVSILLLSYVYVLMQGSPSFGALFLGLKCAVLIVVAEAVARVGRRILKRRALFIFPVAAFCILWTRIVPFPVVIGISAVCGILGSRLLPGLFLTAGDQGRTADAGGPDSALEKRLPVSGAVPVRRSLMRELGRSVLTCVLFLVIWFGPVAVAAKLAGSGSVYVQSSLFFSKAAVVTFGGAYAVLNYVDEQAVENYHWIEKGEMSDGLGMAETTPGPLIMVVQFVGFLAAWRHGTGMHPLLAGTIGAMLATWVTFVPCFLWIFLGAPYVERLLHVKWLNSALTAITASVVGVIATLGLNLAVSTLFAKSESVTAGWFRPVIPVWGTLRWDALAITCLSGVLMFVLHRGLALTLSVCVVVGLLIGWAF